ncbi:MAG TPA: hypothetical protein VHY91_13655 [Pirellulales bacterium]|jgi:hypothetical protein|nr:hypothetical protein [Pirellulales bacterium]
MSERRVEGMTSDEKSYWAILTLIENLTDSSQLRMQLAYNLFKGLSSECLREEAWSDLMKEIEGVMADHVESIGDTLDNATDPNHPDFDSEFNKELRNIRPEWFAEDN